jgi:1,2-diacylglycerol 3-alpha-glucosyltransferase
MISSTLAIVYTNFGPYHLGRLATTTKLGKARGLDVVGIELASKENLRPWTINVQQNVKKYTVIPHKAIEEVPSLSLMRKIWSLLDKLDPKALAIGLSRSTSHAFLAMLLWARLKKRLVIILMDSKFDDKLRNPFITLIKKLMFSFLDSALVSGTYSKYYAELLGLSADKIFVGCDVVDNDYFDTQSTYARNNQFYLRQKYNLPKNYFICVSRLDENKNIFRLLEAYLQYLNEGEPPHWGLVICGSGPLEQELQRQAQRLGIPQVIFAGFKQIHELPIYYGLACCLIIPSLGDTWGLVVNEAMASGLPVLVSRACGCVPDLVKAGFNGFTFDPSDVVGMAQMMVKLSSGEVDLTSLGRASRQIIAEWSLETFGQNLLKAFEAALAG